MLASLFTVDLRVLQAHPNILGEIWTETHKLVAGFCCNGLDEFDLMAGPKFYNGMDKRLLGAFFYF